MLRKSHSNLRPGLGIVTRRAKTQSGFGRLRLDAGSAEQDDPILHWHLLNDNCLRSIGLVFSTNSIAGSRGPKVSFVFPKAITG